MAKTSTLPKDQTPQTGTKKVKSGFWPKFGLLFVVWLVYVGLAFLAPTQAAETRYHLSFIELKLLGATFQLPLLFIWASLLYGANAIGRYAAVIHETKEGKGYSLFAYGLYAILTQSVASSMIGSVRSMVTLENPDIPGTTLITPTLIALTKFSTIVNVSMGLLSFLLIFLGARHLLRELAETNRIERLHPLLLLAFLGLGLGYINGIFDNPFRTVSDDPRVLPTYFLTDSQIWLRVVIPTLVTWFLGLLSLNYMMLVYSKVKGVIYRSFIGTFVIGMSIVLALTMSLPLLLSNPGVFAEAGIGLILAIIYPIFFVIALGYYVIARAAKKLRTIEEV